MNQKEEKLLVMMAIFFTFSVQATEMSSVILKNIVCEYLSLFWFPPDQLRHLPSFTHLFHSTVLDFSIDKNFIHLAVTPQEGRKEGFPEGAAGVQKSFGKL